MNLAPCVIARAPEKGSTTARNVTYGDAGLLVFPSVVLATHIMAGPREGFMSFTLNLVHAANDAFFAHSGSQPELRVTQCT